MRVHEVRNAIIAAVEAIVPTSKAARADTFWLIPADAAELARDRAVQVRYREMPTQTGRLVLTVDSVQAVFELSVAYLTMSEAAHTRIGQDSDLILTALQTLEASATYAQITLIEVASAAVDYIDDPSALLLRYTLRVEFDPRDP